MIRSRIVILVGVLALFASGCNTPANDSTKGGSSDGKKNPSQFTKSELEADIAKRLELKVLSLTDEGNGQYKGKGKNADGEEYDITVTVTDRKMSWEMSRKLEPIGWDKKTGYTTW